MYRDTLDQYFLGKSRTQHFDNNVDRQNLPGRRILTATGSSQTCVDDPRDDCDPQANNADCIGICVYLDGRSAATASSGQICGGFAGIQCPAGKMCVDNPNDSCDPKKGGRDCSGICV